MLRTIWQLAILGLGIVTLASSPASADTETKRLGNTDGKEFAAACPDGMAIAGLGYNYSETQLLAIVPICREVNEAGDPQGPAPKAGKFKGASGGSGGQPLACDTDKVMHSLEAYLTASSDIFSFRPVCQGAHTAVHAMSYSLPYDRGAKPTTSHGEADCGSGAYATALVGTYKDNGSRQGIASIGLRCHDEGAPFGDNAANGKADGGNGGEANNDGQDGLKIDVTIGPDGIKIGAGGGNGAKGGGLQRFLAEAATVYEKKGGKGKETYLDAGARVTLSEQCEPDGAGGEGWCHLAKPLNGWIWGGDLRNQ